MGVFNPTMILAVAAFGGFASGTASQWFPAAPEVAQAAHAASPARGGLAGPTIAQCYAVDGDTLRCGRERVRLLGIDSPEMPGHCRAGRQCAEGDPFAAKAALAGAIAVQMDIRRFGTDAYGRTLALVTGPLGDLSCKQVRSGHAVYRPDWDTDGQLRKRCG